MNQTKPKLVIVDSSAHLTNLKMGANPLVLRHPKNGTIPILELRNSYVWNSLLQEFLKYHPFLSIKMDERTRVKKAGLERYDYIIEGDMLHVRGFKTSCGKHTLNEVEVSYCTNVLGHTLHSNLQQSLMISDDNVHYFIHESPKDDVFDTVSNCVLCIIDKIRTSISKITKKK